MLELSYDGVNDDVTWHLILGIQLESMLLHEIVSLYMIHAVARNYIATCSRPYTLVDIYIYIYRSNKMVQPDDETQIQLSGVQTDQEHSQAALQSQIESQQPTQTPVISTVQVLAIVSLAVRSTTWICLLVSLIILASNTATVHGVYREIKLWFNDLYAYRYFYFSFNIY